MISAVIIAKNEEKNLPSCIGSLLAVADEIIVADTGSTDDTAHISNKLGARVVQLNWMGYAETKNQANALAKYPYILSLDADEMLSEKAINDIVELKNNLQGVYEFKRLNHYCGKAIKYGGWYPDMKIRLFPKDLLWKGNVHERLDIKSQKITYLDSDILHFTYANTQDHIDKIVQYATLASESLKGESKLTLFFKLLISPTARFFKGYFLKKGFLDGKYGFLIAWYGAVENHLKYWQSLKS